MVTLPEGHEADIPQLPEESINRNMRVEVCYSEVFKKASLRKTDNSL